ncbi:hypothetical protein SUSP_002646 [Sulfurospirillum sp. 'SP']|nr:pre-peptidase C-terminal domain-containing protein [Sulfurospirillum sp. 'SP']WNZ00229.1 hypothetical protein SUSP_002646 [Sulfurospirillum sp. 'SP']
MAINELKTQVLQLYTAYFNRVADKAGVDYWLDEMTNNNWSLSTVALTFSQQVEYTNQYTGLSSAQIVSQVYINVLNRTADSAGASYWTGELTNGNINVSQLVQAVINAATEQDTNGNFKHQDDATLFNNKIDVSSYAYTVGSNTTNISLSSITTDSTTVNTVKAQIPTEPNDEKSMATTITLAQAQQGISGSINVTDVTDSADWYKISLSAAGTYTVYMETLAGTTASSYDETVLKVYDSSSGTLLNLTSSGKLDAADEWLRNTFQANQAGDYYIQITRDNNLDAFYDFSIQPSIANGLIQDSNNEPNDEKSMATTITLAQAQQGISGSINVTDVTDSADWYKISLSAAGTYTVYMETLAGTTASSYDETVLKVYDSSSGTLLNLTSSGKLDAADEWLRNTFQANQAGDYYIQITRDNNLDAFYDFSIQPSIANGLIQDSNNEPNDEKSMATTITLAQAQQGISGSINVTDVTDSADWYKISLSAAGTYTVYMETLAGTTASSYDETVLKVYDSSSGTLLNLTSSGKLDAADEWLRNTFQANQAGDYYIQITRDNNLDAFYDFSITIA